MRLASIPAWWSSRGEEWRRRTIALSLALAIHALLLFMLLRLAPPFTAPPAPAPRGVTLDLLPDTEAEPDQSESEAEAEEEQSRPAPAPRPAEVPEAVVELPGPPAPSGSDIWSKVIPLTRQELATVDTAVTRAPEAKESADAGGGRTGRSGASSPVVGSGPDGQPLYAAQWYRRPTRTELSTYMPAIAPREGWGMIICRTIADYRVDDCQELGQSPAGSGLAGAVRQAAWQFRVIPPREGGKVMIGAWVRIRIDYTRGELRY